MTAPSVPASPKVLVLVRHARAEAEAHLGDAKRPLAPRGRAQADALGQRLASEAGPFDVALISAARRTRETYELLAKDSPLYPRPRILEELYGISVRHLLERLRLLDEVARRVIVVGHEPAMSGLAALLHDAHDEILPQVALGIPTGTACVIELPVRWSDLDRGAGHVRAVLRP